MFCKRGTLKNLIKLSWKLLKFRLTIKLLKFQAFVHILHCSNQSVDAMLCVICYHLHNLKNVKSTLGGVLLSVKLQAETYNFTQKFSLHTFSERKDFQKFKEAYPCSCVSLHFLGMLEDYDLRFYGCYFL